MFFPLHVVTEYGVRRPVVAVMDWSERHYVTAWIDRVFHPTWDFSWAPSVYLDLNFLPSAGARMRWRNALVRGNELRALARTGGPDVIVLALDDRVVVDSIRLGVHGEYFHRADQIFAGLGPRSEDDQLARYTLTRREVWGVFEWLPSHRLGLEGWVGYRSEDTGPGIEPSIETRFQVPAAAPGFGSLSLLLGRVRAVVDSRLTDEPLTGVRAEGGVLVGWDTVNGERRFIVADASVQAAMEVLPPGRVVMFALHAADSGSLGNEPVPFTHLPALGRAIHHGFRAGRFIGDSALVAEVEYRYPIWAHLDWLWNASVGNVFRRHFQDFELGVLTGSLGFGIRTRRERHPDLEAMVAFGTNRFEQGFGIESVRLYVGINRGL